MTSPFMISLDYFFKCQTDMLVNIEKNTFENAFPWLLEPKVMTVSIKNETRKLSLLLYLFLVFLENTKQKHIKHYKTFFNRSDIGNV